MAHAGTSSLRSSRLESRRVTLALLISLFLHLGTWGVYEIGKKYGWWQRLQAWSLFHRVEKKNPQLAQKENEPPLIFVDVSHPEPEPPKTAKNYSNKNSQAANPDAKTDDNLPKVDGTQKVIPKTEDAPRPSSLQPTPPPPEPTPSAKPVEEARPQEAMNLGNLKLEKPAEQKTEEQKAAQAPQRPRTIKQALAQQQQLPGQKMQQDGGVRRQRVWSSLDAKATAFGDYDRAIIEAVTQRWYDLLDSHRFAQDRTGRVIVYFKLKPDGTVEEMKILDNTVGNLLGYVCEEAIGDAAPFGKWPSDMRRAIGANYREISFTFYYY